MDILFIELGGTINNLNDIDICLSPIRVSLENIKPFIKLMEYCYKNKIKVAFNEYFDYKLLNKYFKYNKMPEIIDLDLNTLDTIEDKINWLEKNRDITKFLYITADSIDMNKVYNVNCKTGLTNEDIDDIIEIYENQINISQELISEINDLLNKAFKNKIGYRIEAVYDGIIYDYNYRRTLTINDGLLEISFRVNDLGHTDYMVIIYKSTKCYIQINKATRKTCATIIYYIENIMNVVFKDHKEFLVDQN